ncbi:MAG TPA: serine hydrolase domain-containing protein [Pyrinomonadaceae bacterium]|jgi:CubicO group peptidase (beta-lactamase class C family)|nr:serine hydrolase domain-containing protein [Pyrinomonadaceae bacterium]
MKQSISSLAKAFALLILVINSCQAQELAPKLDDYMKAAVKSGRFSGAILVARNGEALLSKGYGMASLELNVPNEAQSKFRIGSLTKQFTAAAVMMLQERGKLNVRESVCKYVPKCPQAWAGVTLHHLLTHTSGIPDLLGFPDFTKTMGQPSPVAETVARFRDKPLEFKPGEKFSYSNSGYVLLGYIIELVSGTSYEDFLRANIFEPLRMTNSGSDHNDLIIKHRAAGYTKRGEAVINAPYIDMTLPTGGGSLYSTVEDMLLWDQALYSDKLLKRGSLDAVFTSYARADWGDGVGYGWFIGKDKAGHRYTGHAGGINGFAAQITRYPEERVLVVVLSNYSFAPVNDIANDLAAIVFGDRAGS